ncbi:hypothetical protein [Tissierella pigra]|uniref:DUF3899 domain-containing protein n=1 Tax=Tissierella pigra TaxID=2607614 RepID=A0A6N7XFL7_9FIRM|nr:hypothetical protein [Tissierella pigra]MSU00779.1 hypothetical protein [Tissierella pigra]
MQRREKRKFIKEGIVGYIQKIIIAVIIVLMIAFIISLLTDANFKKVLGFSALITLTIGIFSTYGSNSAIRQSGYIFIREQSGGANAAKRNFELRNDSYRFFISTGITAGILYIIYLLI